MARSRTSLRFLAATAVLALVPAWGLWQWAGQGPLKQEATVLVRQGEGLDAVARQLEDEGVIRSARLFKLWARARKLQLIRGEYAFKPGVSLSEVARKLRTHDIHFTSVVIPPGAHAWAVRNKLRSFIPDDATFWALWKSPTLARSAGFPEAASLEGLVAPATYKLHHALEPEEILLEMVEAFRRQVLPKLEGGTLPPYQTLTLASLVEKETNVPDERAKVAGVYAKRLGMGMRLQCDPTSLYARWLCGDLRFTGPTPADVHRAHPYNTYTIAGLPPTPIAIPSAEAIEAALRPETGKDLYFVATGTGGHRFAPDLNAHNRNVSAYRKEIARQKGGRR